MPLFSATGRAATQHSNLAALGSLKPMPRYCWKQGSAAVEMPAHVCKMWRTGDAIFVPRIPSLGGSQIRGTGCCRQEGILCIPSDSDAAATLKFHASRFTSELETRFPAPPRTHAGPHGHFGAT